ncbi:MAG: ABC transporter permease [Candidatus Staskawiczbacteria bacterium]|nr:ABC transporter permease [Candidatus Staskawiczbacteria bacterium]
MVNSFQQSIRALKSNPIRTVLTTLGIVIGIATVITVLSAGAGFRSLIDAELAAWGTDTLFVETKVPPTTKNLANNNPASADLSRAASTVQITTFKLSDLTALKKLNNVSGAYGMVTGLSVVNYRNNAKNSIYFGVGADMFSIDKHTLKKGRFFTQTEDAGAVQVAILGSNLANDLFGQDEPVGKLIRVGNLNFQVIGVYNAQGSFSAGGADDSLYMPLVTAQKKMLGVNYITIGVVQLKDTNLGDATAELIRSTMRSLHSITNPNKDDFMVTTQAQALETFNTIFNGITILLIAIASISLIVGGVGIMNIMYVVVTERTAEIGLKKALGARSSDISREFLVESILVTVLGGILGIILGSVMSWLVSLIASYNGLAWIFSVPLYSIIIAVGVSAAIGISFGVMPARSAAKLDPIEALRYE